MAEELQAGICGENVWSSSMDSTRIVFPLNSSSSSSSISPCSAAANDAGSCSTWQNDLMDLKASRSTCGVENNNNLVSDDSYQLGFPDASKPHKHESTGSILIDSTLQMMGFGLSSSTSSNWDHSLFRCNERAEGNFNSMLEEETSIEYSSNNSQIQKSYSSSVGSTVDIFKPMNQEFCSDGLPIGSASSYGCHSTMMQSLLYEPDPSLFTNRSISSYSSAVNYGASSNEVSPIWSKLSSSFLKPSPSSMAAKQQPNIGLHFSNNTPFWNASAEALDDMRAGVFASSPSQFKTPTFQHKSDCPTILLNKVKSEESLDSASVGKKSVCEPAFKRARIETPSPLPTFKVRKEKLGDRVTALQQLVSPFGKTDTASVLHEAIEYIKFLHDQVRVLSTPYMKSGAPIQRQQGCDDNKKESESGAKQDLRSRGLCLVPISSTFPVATETTADFWSPSLSFGGAILR